MDGYKDPIVRELERQKEQGFLQAVNGRIDRNYEFTIRTDGSAQGLPAYLEVVRNVPFLNAAGTYGRFQTLVYMIIPAWIVLEPGNWQYAYTKSDEMGKEKLDGITKLVNSYTGGPISIDVDDELSIGGNTSHLTQSTRKGSFCLKVAMEKSEDIPIDKIGRLLEIVGNT